MRRIRVFPALEPHRGYRNMKRAVDVVLACLLLVLMAAVLLLIAGLILATSGRPVLFRQRRLGLSGREFTCYKFRTMVQGADERKAALRHLSVVDGPVFKLVRDPRVTRVGRFLRVTSLDELPQLFNIIRGEMSFVGPRPLAVDENRYQGEQVMRLSVKPGLTCIWQVSGRSNVGFQEWMEMDLEYVRSRSILLDAALLLKTVPAVLSRKGAM